MTAEEKTLLKTYLVNQMLRVDQDVVSCREIWQQQPSSLSAFRLVSAHQRQENFNLYCAHLYALLHLDA